jgi:hypothetical protein
VGVEIDGQFIHRQSGNSGEGITLNFIIKSDEGTNEQHQPGFGDKVDEDHPLSAPSGLMYAEG